MLRSVLIDIDAGDDEDAATDEKLEVDDVELELEDESNVVTVNEEIADDAAEVVPQEVDWVALDPKT
jgi:hypothetical protein